MISLTNLSLWFFRPGVCGRFVAGIRGAVDRGAQEHNSRRDGLVHRGQTPVAAASRVVRIGRSSRQCHRPGVQGASTGTTGAACRSHASLAQTWTATSTAVSTATTAAACLFGRH